MTSNMELGLFLFAIALVLAGIAWRMLQTDRENVRLAAASSAWPTASGHVQSCEVVKHVATRRDNETNQDIEQITYEPTVSYVYAVGGKELAGNRLSFKRAHYISDKKANAAVAQFPTGATVAVAYDPADPQNSVLDRETKPSAVSLWTAILMISTAAVAVFGIVMLTAAG
jgi:hypothetical protein